MICMLGESFCSRFPWCASTSAFVLVHAHQGNLLEQIPMFSNMGDAYAGGGCTPLIDVSQIEAW